AVGAIPGAGFAARRVFSGPDRPVACFGLSFKNPIGLAAGYDKDGIGVQGLQSLGFGHIEVGTVTPLPQSGNPQPRVFRLAKDRAVINRLGFPSRGADFVAGRLRRLLRSDVIVGVNIGKNKDTPLEAASEDYVSLISQFAPLSDYLVVNISSPNTVGLRRLQARGALEGLIGTLVAHRNGLTDRGQAHVPLLVKLSPDLDDRALDDALQVLLDTGVDGVVATNTTLGRDGLQSPARGEKGGLSGAPLTKRATEVIAKIAQRTHGKLPIIGVGGVASAHEARAKLDAGATLVQLYSGLIYEGPGLVRRILKGL
ncbi:MAG: dihydroorotate dehydrogenase, partial [Myxococcota bacterium]